MTVYIPIRGPEINELNSEYERFLKDFSCFTKTDELKKLVDDELKHGSLNQIRFNIIYSSKDIKQEDPEIEKINQKYLK